MAKNLLEKALQEILDAATHCPTPAILHQLKKDIQMILQFLDHRIKKL